MNKIYIYNALTKTVHIKGLCPNGSEIGNELYETEDDIIKTKGKSFIMCQTCERKKEEILQKAVKI
ncbi:MAG: hypothetical protein J6S13_08400 [Clostridia bacterium]|nr:hypothetical protein [Clostridia bacterium]